MHSTPLPSSGPKAGIDQKAMKRAYDGDLLTLIWHAPMHFFPQPLMIQAAYAVLTPLPGRGGTSASCGRSEEEEVVVEGERGPLERRAAHSVPGAA